MTYNNFLHHRIPLVCGRGIFVNVSQQLRQILIYLYYPYTIFHNRVVDKTELLFDVS